MITNVSKAVTVKCPFRDGANDEYAVLVSVRSYEPSLDVPTFLAVLNKYEGTKISGEHLCKNVREDITKECNAITVGVSLMAINTDDVLFHVQSGELNE